MYSHVVAHFVITIVTYEPERDAFMYITVP